MYEPPSEDPRPICEYCGGVITEHPQLCVALDAGYCHPDPAPADIAPERAER